MEENRTILIVDDEPETLKGYQEFLTPREETAARKTSRRPFGGTGPAPASGPSVTEQYRLLVAKSGEEAIQLMQKEIKEGRRVAAGFFDVKLEGGMDGLATIHAIKSLDKDIHCVVVTAYHDRSVEEIHQLFGEDFKDQWDYLNKPFTQGEIVQKARQMVAAWNRKRQIEIMQRQLLQSERLAAVGQVARGIGHEFGNILLRVIGKCDLALMENDVKKIHDHLNVLMRAAERAGVIVKNLQTFAKTEPIKQLLDPSAPIEEALSLVSHELVKSNVTLEKNLNLTGRKLMIDSGAIAQVLLNLFINATYAMPKGGTLRVTLEDAKNAQGKEGAAFRIKDTGTGIPASVLPRIFEFAFTTKGDRGSGLGLSISREIVLAHGGELTVKTEEGKGTEFSIWLPNP